jgi:DNA-binding NarL/FixJ family response regulator
MRTQTFDRLTNRERDVVNREIAERLNISVATVRHHLTSIFSKLRVPNRQKLLLQVLEDPESIQ